MTINIPYNVVVLWGVDRIKKNKNLIILIVGSTGSGKTFAGFDLALKFAKQLGTKFTVKENMDFNFTNLLKKATLPENSKPGTVFLFEEVGATGGGATSREWQSRENINFNSFMQTSRHRNQIIIMTCPDFAYLEKGTRKLVHLLMVMKGIDYYHKISYAKSYVLQNDPLTGKIYKKYLRVTYDGKGVAVKQTKFNNPPQEVIDEYEKLKTEYTSGLYTDMVSKKEKQDKNKDLPKLMCPFCSYKWISKVEHPKLCPKCKKRQDNPTELRSRAQIPKEIKLLPMSPEAL